jgi:hypothetical protein
MPEKTTGRKRFEDEIPEEVREHFRVARHEMRESIRALFPPAFVEHRRTARKEVLLALRSMIDSALDGMDEKNKKA